MGITGEKKTINEAGQDKEGYSVLFTNGAYDQLKELTKFLKDEGLPINDELDAIKFGIGYIQYIKEEKSNKEPSGEASTQGETDAAQ